MVKKYLIILCLPALVICCSKKGNDNGTEVSPATTQASTLAPLHLSYGDSIFYMPPSGKDKVVIPLGSLKGTYTGFPEGIELDKKTGAINISKSETGLRYRISFTAKGKTDTISTVILLSGINYQDNIYSLEKKDTLAPPIYNGQPNKQVPGSRGTNMFDEGGGCKSLGIEVNPNNGIINLQSVIRNKVLGNNPKNGSQKEVDLFYRINDGSKKALNKVRVKFYYFDSPEDITPDLIEQMKERKGMFIGVPGTSPFFELNIPNTTGFFVSNNSSLSTAKPRPPCIFIVRRSAKR